MTTTKIEWADRVWNPVTGCTKISPGCDHCYAERMSHRLAANPALRHRTRYKNFKVSMWRERLELPLTWKKPSRVFVNSMGDLFHKDVSLSFIAEMFNVMAIAHDHTFMILTKRPKRMREVIEQIPNYLRNHFKGYLSRALYQDELWPLKNVWLGITTEDQKQADERTYFLITTPAAKRFVSVEPMLGPVKFTKLQIMHLNWIIVGGETGPGARPMDYLDARILKDQCQSEGIPFFFKQWGSYYKDKNVLPPHVDRAMPNVGNLLDGRTWQEFPE